MFYFSTWLIIYSKLCPAPLDTYRGNDIADLIQSLLLIFVHVRMNAPLLPIRLKSV